MDPSRCTAWFDEYDLHRWELERQAAHERLLNRARRARAGRAGQASRLALLQLLLLHLVP